MKKKICIVADVPNWSFDSIAKKIKKDLSYKFDIQIEYFNRRTEAEYFFEFIEKVKKYDIIHFLNRRMLLLIETDTFKHKVNKTGKNLDNYIEEIKNKFSTSVYDHIDLDPKGIQEHKNIYNKYTKMYYTATKKLFDIYSEISEFKKPDYIINDICDNQIYIPINLERFNYENIKNREIVIGWVGNSKHNDEKDIDLKGFRTIIKPVINQLINEGFKIKGHYADRNDKWRTPKEMVKYYSEIDLCLCASIHEGTPRPVLESMYCGIPIISTDVGIVNEALGKKQKNFILGSRENGKNDEIIKNALKEKIIELYTNREKFKELSEENLKSINIYDGGKIIKDFEYFFDKCLSHNKLN